MGDFNLQSVEDHIKAEYNVVRAWIATHQTVTLSTTLALGVCGALWFVGRLHIPF